MTLKASEATAKSVRRSGEVCQELDIQPYVLKFWEAEFPQLSRRIGPKRLYGPEEFQIAERIKRLLQDDGLTLAEAREALAGQLSRGEIDATDVLSKESSAPSAISSSVVAAIVDDIEGSARAASTGEGGPSRAQLAQVIQERDAAEGREARARREVAELQSALVSVREELRAVRTELESTAKDRDQSFQRFEHATEELGDVRQKLEQAQAAIATEQQTSSQLSDQLAQSRAESSARATELDRSQSTVSDVRGQLEREQKSLQEAKARTASLNETQKKLEALDRELKAEKTRTAEALNQVRALQEKIKSEGERHGRLKLDLTREIDLLLGETRALSSDVAGMLVSLGGEAHGVADQLESERKPTSANSSASHQRKPAEP